MDSSFDLRSLGECVDGKGSLAAALAIAAGTHAYATPVHFDNPMGPGHYEWNSFLGNNLDIRVGPEAQADVEVDGVSVNPDYVYDSGYYSYTSRGFYYGYYAGFAQSSLFGGASFLRNGFYLLSVTPGTMIGGGGQMFDYERPSDNLLLPYADLSFYYYDSGYNTYSGLRSFFTPGLNYIGLRLSLNSARGIEFHYGWLAVDVQEYGLDSAYGRSDLAMYAFTNAVAWGWETEANTPVAAGAAPAPGTLAALAFGGVAAGAVGRGRRKKNA